MKTAWLGEAKVKKHFVNQLLEHRRLEHLVQGVGFEKNGTTKGCNIGCLFEHYDHAKGEQESGIPEVLLRLADTIFEGLPAKKANDFAVEWPKAIKPGADISRVRWQFCAFILKENIKRVLLLKIKDKLKEQVVSAIKGVCDLHEKAAITGEWNQSAARSAWSAESAAWSAARSAARSAWSAAWSAWSAAESAASAASAAYQHYANELLRLLRKAA